MGNLTISMAIFNSKLLVHQRLSGALSPFQKGKNPAESAAERLLLHSRVSCLSHPGPRAALQSHHQG